MKVLFHCPDWGNRWIPYVKKELDRYDLHFTHSIKDAAGLAHMADVLISGWLNEVLGWWTQNYPDKKIISWCRRYEMFAEPYREAIDVEKIDALIFVSEFWKEYFNKTWQHEAKIKQYVIPNGIDLDAFELKPKSETHKLAMVCQLRAVKNIPLALEILQMLPEDYTLHHIGLPGGDMNYLDPYIQDLGLKDRVFFEGQKDDVAGWLQDKEFILSTSINEGNPNNIIEAMAMGIKPIIHNWPGAKNQFPYSCVFNTATEAVDKILENYYRPQEYRNHVEERYSLKNFERLHDVIRAVFPVENRHYCGSCGLEYSSKIDGGTPINWTCECGYYNNLEN